MRFVSKSLLLLQNQNLKKKKKKKKPIGFRVLFFQFCEVVSILNIYWRHILEKCPNCKTVAK
jgi:hypothetical protein